ncbi:MAG: PD-(D/E)XK nuclease family protein, partial [Actinomycetota bacterium]|nr:PD-(D/E)XK nuclease family protein [Actinomycetota bacterium]
MALPLPATLSPSKVASFKDCALAFKFSAIDRLPEPPSIAATRGTLVHLALQHLFGLPRDERTLQAAQHCLERATTELRPDPEFSGLELDAAAEEHFLAEAEQLVQRYFELEDPTTINPIGIELMLEARIGDLRVRGIIDRLELDAEGELVVTDYKTGRAPVERYEQGRLGGVHFYSFLCEELLGRRPARVQLLYLADPLAITTVPTDQSTRGLRTKLGAIWSAVELACEREDFRPKPGPLCTWCSFKDRCPAFANDRESNGMSVETPTLAVL